MIKKAKLEVVSVNQMSIAMLNHTLHVYIQRKNKSLQNENVKEGDEYHLEIKKI